MTTIYIYLIPQKKLKVTIIDEQPKYEESRGLFFMDNHKIEKLCLFF